MDRNKALMDKLVGTAVSLSTEEADACLALFRLDAAGELRYVPQFFSYHYSAARLADLPRAHEEQGIRQNYIYNLSRQRNTDTGTLNVLFLHSAEYYYSIRVYSECIRCLFSVLESKTVLPTVLSGATSLLFSVLAESGLYEQCFPYLERSKKAIEEKLVPPQTVFLQEMSFMQLYGFSGDVKTAEAYYRKLKNADSLPEGFGPVELAYLDLAYLSIEAVNRKGSRPGDGYYADVMRACEALTADSALMDSNYSVTLLPILQYMRPHIEDAQLLALFARFLRFVYTTFDLLALCSYLFDEAGIAPEAAPELFEQYLSMLRLYYKKDRDNHRQLVENALLTQAMEADYRRKAVTDRLTGLGNRLAYTELFQHHVTAPGAPEPELCLVMMDLDDLKRQNDLYGHAAGDQLIRSAADAMRTAFTEKTDLFRYGGDEFIALLKCDEKDVKEMLRRLDEACRDWTQSRVNLLGVPLSVSAGYAFVHEITEAVDNAERLREVCELADQRMYEAKKRRHAGSSDRA